MATRKVRYKNHATPQEQTLPGGRWYLDSDSGRKLTGDAVVPDMAEAGVLVEDVAITTVTTSLGTSKDFVYIKNTGTGGIEALISLTTDTAAEYVIALADGEAFASKVSNSATIRVITASGATTIEHFTET